MFPTLQISYMGRVYLSVIYVEIYKSFFYGIAGSNAFGASEQNESKCSLFLSSGKLPKHWLSQKSDETISCLDVTGK